MSPDRARNQERLCWLEAVAIYWAGVDWTAIYSRQPVRETSEGYTNKPYWSLHLFLWSLCVSIFWAYIRIFWGHYF
jgi:hypothetical protein